MQTHVMAEMANFKLSNKSEEAIRIEVLLATLCLFSEHGREEISLAELQECIFDFQKEFPLGYEFFKTFPSSLDLLMELQSLCEEGYSYRYTYSHDNLMPKAFVRLTPLGRWRAKTMMGRLSPDVVEALNKAIINAISNYKKTWGLWARCEES